MIDNAPVLQQLLKDLVATALTVSVFGEQAAVLVQLLLKQHPAGSVSAALSALFIDWTMKAPRSC